LNLQTYAIIALSSYFLGSIPFGYLLVKIFKKEDIRATGSGNIGATNVARSGAKGLAIATLALDALKGSLAVLVTRHFFSESPTFTGATLLALAALFVILGHCFPLWLKFRGGKGVATSLGAFAILAPKAVLIGVLVFIAVFAFTRYVSFGSVLSALAVPPIAYYFGMPLPALLLLSVACLLVVVKHHANIGRLLAGTEKRFGAKPV
jgi:glycerol-3-phosphate acyltransferase PlsY